MTTSSVPSRRFYSPPNMQGVDCDGMRPLNEHAKHLDYLMERVLHFAHDRVDEDRDDVLGEWDQVRQWLQMVAGLEYVDVMPIANDSWGMCEQADAYDDAKNDLVSDVATEETRLLYAWGAMERLLRVIRLPQLADKQANRPLYNRASRLITDSYPAERSPAHYNHVVQHLRHHIRADAGLRSDQALREASEERPWRGANSVLLPLGAAMRNIPAHGASVYGEPSTWGDDLDRSETRKLATAAHAPRLACRGLLLSLQQLLAITTVTDQNSDFEAEEFGWPIMDHSGAWTLLETPRATDLLVAAHLQPPSDLI